MPIKSYWRAQVELYLNAINAEAKLASGINLSQDEHDAYYHLKKSNMLSDLHNNLNESHSNYIEQLEKDFQEANKYKNSPDVITANIHKLRYELSELQKDVQKYKNSEYSDTLKTKIMAFQDKLKKVQVECDKDLERKINKK
jgi:hypothetical protein